MNTPVTTTAKRINALHGELEALLHKGIEKAIEIGQLLTEKKAELKHGEFGTWITENLVFTDRTARRYMNLFENKDKALAAGNISEAYKMLGEGKTDTVSDLYTNGWNWNPEQWPEKLQELYKIINKMKDGETVTGFFRPETPNIWKADIINIERHDEDFAYYELLFFNAEDESGHTIYNERPLLIEGLMFYLSQCNAVNTNSVLWHTPGMKLVSEFKGRKAEPFYIN